MFLDRFTIVVSFQVILIELVKISHLLKNIRRVVEDASFDGPKLLLGDKRIHFGEQKTKANGKRKGKGFVRVISNFCHQYVNAVGSTLAMKKFLST